MTIENIYLRVRSQVWLSRVVYLVRMLIGFAFIPSGMKKVLGLRFTQIPDTDPIGYFFEAMYQTGFYWNFLGWGQILAALLLMTQRFATLGAVLFSFIAANIFMITISLHFPGTWLITLGLLFASICLLLWDYNKLKFIFFTDNFSSNDNYLGLPQAGRAWMITGMVLYFAAIGLSLKLAGTY
ncbi:MAG: hypothetical protein ABIN95_06240 [Mucilaginibacter sp.]